LLFHPPPRVCLFQLGKQNFSSQPFRTEECSPRNHSAADLGRFYTVPPQVPKLFGKEFTSREFYNATNFFGPRQWTNRCAHLQETAIMVREPTLHILDCIRSSDLSRPVNRYLLYGRPGSGKSTCLSHLIHFGHEEGFVVMPLPYMKKWLTKYYEVAPSTFTPGNIDHITNSNVFLKNFRQANPDRLENCVTHREYVWSVREKTPAGAPLAEVLEVGCERLPFAADALNVMIRELKLNSSEGNCKLMVVCDGINSLFSGHTLVHKEKRRKERGNKHFLKPTGNWLPNCVPVDQCSVLRNIKKLFLSDWSGGVVVGSVCVAASVVRRDPGNKWWRSKQFNMEPDNESHLPFALLGEEGWRVCDPFLPVEVPTYSESELDSHISYYIERGWLGSQCDSQAARQEIHFLSGRNPGDFFKFSPMF